MRGKSRWSLRGNIAAALESAEGLLTDHCSLAEMTGYPVKLKTRKEAEAYIKGQLKLYVESWLLPPLRAALAKAQKKEKLPKPARGATVRAQS